jgi:hypothetical protein
MTKKRMLVVILPYIEQVALELEHVPVDERG